jgi:transcriptional regulator with XRE-family HTH domain
MKTAKRFQVWKARRIVGGFRQLDLALALGISATRYSLLERGEVFATLREVREIERILPPLPLPVVEELRMARSP